MKFWKDEKNALLTKQNERQGFALHCNVTVAAWRRENTRDIGAALWRLGKLAGDANVFRWNILIRTGDLLILFYISILRSSFYVKITEMTMSGLVLS